MTETTMKNTTRTIQEEAIAQLVMSRLATDIRTSGQTIDVYVQDAEVFLVGTCDTAEQKAAAAMIAAGICGVRRVINNIRVRKLAQAI